MSDVLKLIVKQPQSRPGEPFSCVLLLDPRDERVSLATKLTVSLERRVSRKRINDLGRTVSRETERTSEVSWSPELPLRMEYNVTLTLPGRAPLTYDGKVLAIEWHLVAQLDVPKKQSGYLDLPVRVVPRGST